MILVAFWISCCLWRCRSFIQCYPISYIVTAAASALGRSVGVLTGWEGVMFLALYNFYISCSCFLFQAHVGVSISIILYPPVLQSPRRARRPPAWHWRTGRLGGRCVLVELGREEGTGMLRVKSGAWPCI